MNAYKVEVTRGTSTYSLRVTARSQDEAMDEGLLRTDLDYLTADRILVTPADLLTHDHDACIKGHCEARP